MKASVEGMQEDRLTKSPLKESKLSSDLMAQERTDSIVHNQDRMEHFKKHKVPAKNNSPILSAPFPLYNPFNDSPCLQIKYCCKFPYCAKWGWGRYWDTGQVVLYIAERQLILGLPHWMLRSPQGQKCFQVSIDFYETKKIKWENWNHNCRKQIFHSDVEKCTFTCFRLQAEN